MKRIVICIFAKEVDTSTADTTVIVEFVWDIGSMRRI